MKIIKNIIATIIDVLVLIVLTISTIVISGNTIGRFSIYFSDSDVEKNITSILIIGGVIIVIYFILSGFNKWKTIGRQLLSNSSKILWKSIVALIIDFTIILLIAYAADSFIIEFVYFQFFYLLAILVLVHHLLVGILRGKSLGKMFFGIQIKGNKNSLSIIQSLKREVLFKFGLLFFCPWLLFTFMGIVDPYHLFINSVGWALLSSSFFFVFKGQFWWNKLSETHTELAPITKPIKIRFFVIVVGVLISLLLIIRYSNKKHQNSTSNTLGFYTPLNFQEYPNSPNIKPYVEFMVHQNTSPKDYILGLFDKYDIVVLCETVHGESTQWELISEIVNDRRFVENVGTVFTEYGSARDQAKVDTFLTRKFDSEKELEKATASIMNYMSGGFYYFIKNLNKQNSQLPDSLKVREYFTDILDHSYWSRWFDETGLNLEKRDSLMAKVTIDWYKERLKQGKRKKCLIVTNTRHAYGYPGGVERLKKLNHYHLTSDNQAQYIFEAFPNQTACVMQNFPINMQKTIFMPLVMPINKGIWDKAYQENNYKPVGFNLKGSPFGLDYFDMYPLLGEHPKVLYQDIFTGVIFNKRLHELEAKDYPYKLYAVENEYKQKHPQAGSETIRKKIQQSRWAGISNKADNSDSKSRIEFLSFANILSLIIVIFSCYFSLFILTISLLFHLFKKPVNKI